VHQLLFVPMISELNDKNAILNLIPFNISLLVLILDPPVLSSGQRQALLLLLLKLVDCKVYSTRDGESVQDDCVGSWRR